MSRPNDSLDAVGDAASDPKGLDGSACPCLGGGSHFDSFQFADRVWESKFSELYKTNPSEIQIELTASPPQISFLGKFFIGTLKKAEDVNSVGSNLLYERDAETKEYTLKKIEDRVIEFEEFPPSTWTADGTRNLIT